MNTYFEVPPVRSTYDFLALALAVILIGFLISGCAELVYKNTETTAAYKKGDKIIVRHSCTKIQTPIAPTESDVSF